MAQTLWFMLGKMIVRLYARLFLQMNVHWKTKLPAGAKIIAVNHPTTTDPAWISALLPGQNHILIAGSLFEIPAFGASLRWSGHIPVVKGSGQTAIDRGVELLRQGKTVIIFPEGSLSPLEGELNRGRSGAVRMALLSGAPIIPVGVALQKENVRTIPVKEKNETVISRWYLHGRYAVTFGEAWNVRGNIGDREQVQIDTLKLIQRITWLVQESRDRIAAELFQNSKGVSGALVIENKS